MHDERRTQLTWMWILECLMTYQVHNYA